MNVTAHNMEKKKIDSLLIPNHVAIIMDGNGRWAKKINKERFFGHNSGIKSVRESIDISLDNRVEVTIPIEDEKISNQLNDIFSIYWNDNQKSRYVNSENNNEYRKNELGIIRSQSQVYNYHNEK